MAAVTAQKVHSGTLFPPSVDLNDPDTACNSAPLDPTIKYAQERSKRLNGGGAAQYVDLRHSERHASLLEDPWIHDGEPIREVLGDGRHTKVCILGAGFGGILFAVALIRQGWKAENLVIVDSAGGFGGTWYWNRYPGLMCDVESYLYMPLLEEMDYMPTRKYVSGEELRLYAEKIVDKYGLRPRGIFQTSIKGLHWNGSTNEWHVSLQQKPKGGHIRCLSIRSDFVILANGILNEAKMPKIKGSELFRGDMFHTARWRYDLTGGTPAEPDLKNLEGRRVGIIGTGATGIQVTPQLAKWASHLYVFQRTPSAVDIRANRDTDPTTWKTSIASRPGWQYERNMNMFGFLNNVTPKPSQNLVNDQWTRFPSYSALLGGPSYDVTPANVADHVTTLHALDRPRSERVRKRVEQEVHAPETAKKLQAWYPGWCKRPCFHDEYLPTFNRENVTLVDTDGKGIDRMTEQGIVAARKEYELDVVIWSTGFIAPGGGMTEKAGIEIIGRDGLSLDEKFENGMATLHGVMSRSFPNLFWSGVRQAGPSPNQMFQLEQHSRHVAYMMTEACRKVDSGKPIIEASEAAEEAWVQKILSTALYSAAVAGCTPSYLNKEGEIDGLSMEEKMKLARGGTYGKGIAAYVAELEAWRRKGDLDGLEVEAGLQQEL